ncbi:MAG TPA: branched-chain amino acid ABC transporter permease [Dehalococcoidia bacterium]|nr:branched-chain amino acid ABC transporter permease [Dehalococcoidia bacterium]HLE81050.1 branched-chain amino acid ABC transporter permease [Dehalococcoidia bacterium]
MSLWAIQLLNGISFGMLLFLLSAGLTLTFGLMNILNLTHGSYYLLGGYIGLTVARATGNFVLAALAGSLAVGVIGILTQRGLLNKFGRDEMGQILITFGLLFLFGDLALWAWGGTPRTIPKPPLFEGSFPVGEVMFPTYRLFLVGIGAATALFLWWFQEGTRVGAQVRASVDDAEMSEGVSVNVPLVMTGVFALGAVLAGAAGVFGGPLVGVYPGADFEVLLLAFVVVIVGGIGSLKGALVGALVVGLLDTFGRAFMPELSLFAIFAPMAIILLVRPAGLLPRS